MYVNPNTEEKMQDRKMNSVACNMNNESSVIPWSFDTNWIVARGSLEGSVTVESSDDPIDESGPENPARKPPLMLKPRAPDSGPCEIKICFGQKYEVGQIYVRSTARTYEIYCTHSPHSINDYLCTVRCGVAERDDKVLQTNSFEDVVEEHGESRSGEATAERATDGGNAVTGEDDWIKIKVPASDNISANGLNTVQDFYEATAEISDSDPCLSLTIRLLSLQDKGHVCVDEIYVFVDPIESTDSGNEELMSGSSAQSSLMAMFMPTLLQLSKSGVSRIQDKCASDEVLKDGKMETGSRIIDEIDCQQQYVEPKEHGKDTAQSSEFQQDASAKKCVEPENINDLPPGRLEIALEQLVSRLSRVEDICLRFEEKMLKPIESIEARLQQVENQLEKLAKNSHNVGLPHCTRISAPAFSCSESNSSSLYNDQSDYLPHGASDLEKKDFSCNMPELSHVANFHPSLIVSAPEFSCDEGEEDNDDLKSLKDSPCIKPKKTLSIDDALAASLNRFLSTAMINPSELIRTNIRVSSQPNEENQYQGHAESCQLKTQEFPTADNGNIESSQYAQVLTVKAPDFTAEETGNQEHLSYTHSSLVMASVTESDKDDHGDDTVPPSIQSNRLFTSVDSCDSRKNESINDFESASNGDSPAVSVKISGTCLSNGHLSGNSEVNVIDSYFERETSFCPAGVSKGSAPDLAEHSVETSRLQISDETNPLGRSTSFNIDDQGFQISDETNPLGRSTTFIIDDQGFQISDETNPLGRSTTFIIDDQGFQISDETNPLGRSTTFIIDDQGFQISDETNPLGRSTTFNIYDQDNASDLVLGHESESVSKVLERHVAAEGWLKYDLPNVSESSNASSLDFEFPILEVKFTSDVYKSTKNPLEALLDGVAESNAEGPSVDATGNDDGNTEQTNAGIMGGDETTDLLHVNHLLVDLEVSAADGSSNLEGISHNLCTPSTPEMNVSLI